MKVIVDTNLWISFAETIGANYIVSGDADLTDLRFHKQTKIIKPADFKSLMQYD